MEFGPIRDQGTLDICNDCGVAFDHINEESIELRCPNCQSAWRIRKADQMHKEQKFPGMEGYIWLSISAKYPEHLAWLKYREYMTRLGLSPNRI